MASYTGNGSNPRAPIYSQDIMDEVRAFNAGLTPAGNKAHPSRSRGGGGALARGRSTAAVSSRPSTIVPAPTIATRTHAPGATRSGNASAWGLMGPYTIGPTTAAPVFKATSPPKVRNTSPNGSVNGPAIVGRPVAPTRPRSPTRPSILVQEAPNQPVFPPPNATFGRQGQHSSVIFGDQAVQGNGTLGNQGIQTNDLFGSPGTPSNGTLGGQGIQGVTFGNLSMFEDQGALGAQSNDTFGNQSNSSTTLFQPMSSQSVGTLAGQPVPSPGRHLIVTNMTPDDPTKPWIPAHLQQKSATEALMEIAGLVGMSFEELIGDGNTLGSRPRGSFHGVASLGGAKSTPNSNFQASVDPNSWMSAATQNPASANLPTNGGNLQGEARVPSYEMDVDMVDGVPVSQPRWKELQDVSHTLAELPKLSESRWATSSFAAASSGPNVTTAAGTFGNASNENIKPAVAKPTFSSFDVNKIIASELAKGSDVVTQPVAPPKAAQHQFFASGFGITEAPNTIPAQPAQSPFTSGFNAPGISRNIANDLARATHPAPAEAANGFATSQEPSYSDSPFEGPAAGWAQAPAPVQYNPFNLEHSPAANHMSGATAQTNAPKPTVASTSATPAVEAKVYYLADSRWAQ